MSENCDCSCPPGTARCQPPSVPVEVVSIEQLIRETVRDELARIQADPAAGKPWGPQKL
jgi:hypothetical protein